MIQTICGCISSFALLIFTSNVAAQVYKCPGPGGKTLYQDFPCNLDTQNAGSIGGRTPSRSQPDGKPTVNAELIEETRACNKLEEGSDDRQLCIAKLGCIEQGGFGATRRTCLEEAERSAYRKIEDAKRAKSREEENRKMSTQQPSSPALDTAPVDCADLYSYARARGNSWMEAVAIAREAEQRGSCVKRPIKP